jgi:hypothetical protein
MKHVFTLLLLLAAATSRAGSDNDAPTNVLVVGLDRERVTSNYYPDGMIAEKIGLPLDSVAPYINRAIVARLAGTTRGAVRFIRLDDANGTREVTNHARYEGDAERSHGDLSRVAREDFNRLLDAFNADYLLVVSQYYMKKQDEPFPFLYHVINYEVYDRSKAKRYEGYAGFDTPDLLPAPQLDKHYRKIVDRMADRVCKVIK